MKDLDIALGHLGQIIESINAMAEHLRSQLSGEDLDRPQGLRTRVEQSWELYLLLEDVIAEFTERHRATNYGPFRDRTPTGWHPARQQTQPHLPEAPLGGNHEHDDRQDP